MWSDFRVNQSDTHNAVEVMQKSNAYHCFACQLYHYAARSYSGSFLGISSLEDGGRIVKLENGF